MGKPGAKPSTGRYQTREQLHEEVLALLKTGHSYGHVARICAVSISTAMEIWRSCHGLDDKRLYPRALAVADHLVKGLKGQGFRVAVCGSLRRGAAHCNDIDLVVSPPLSRALEIVLEMEDGVILPGPKKVKVSTHVVGEERCRFDINGNMVDLFMSGDEGWGAMVLSRTGNWLFNRVIRGIAKNEFGYKLNDHGLWFNDEIIAGRSEFQIFEALGLEYLPPQERELKSRDQGKIRRL